MKKCLSSLWFKIRIRVAKWYLTPVILTFVFLVSTGFGEVTHWKIGSRIPGVSHEYLEGSVMADLAMFRFGGTPYAMEYQLKFHSPTFVSNLQANASTSRQANFARGWRDHVLIEDPIEVAYGSTHPSPYSVEFAIDAILANQEVQPYPSAMPFTVDWGNPDSNELKELIILTFAQTYPGNIWHIEYWDLESAARGITYYLGGLYSAVSPPPSIALIYYPDYLTAINQAIIAVGGVPLLGVTPTPTSTPKPTLSPSPTPSPTPTMVPTPTVSPTLVPTSTPSPSPIPSPTPIQPTPTITPSPTPTVSPSPSPVPLPTRPRRW